MNLLSDGLQALKQQLSSVPSLAFGEVSPDEVADASPDIALRVRYAGGDQTIFADVKSSGQPRLRSPRAASISLSISRSVSIQGRV